MALLKPAQACLSCRAPVYRKLALCEACEADLPWQRPGCQCCGIAWEDERCASAAHGPYPALTQGPICHNCLHTPPHYDRCMALFAYQLPVSSMIKEFKEHAGFSEARCLGQLAGAAFRQHYFEQDHVIPEFLLPVPLHHSRLSQRGFNQSLMLCHAISAETGVPVLRHACERLAGRHAQRGLGARARQHNMQGVFYAGRQANLTAGKHIAIIDDVVTTTATVNAMAAELRQQGAAQIDVWCLARAN